MQSAQVAGSESAVTETVFAFDENNYHRCQEAYRGAGGDYYLGEYRIEPGPVIDVRAEKKQVGPCSIVRLRARTRQSFRREWSHIRADGADVTILWFVRNGQLQVSHDGGCSLAGPGDFLVTRSNQPFAIDCDPDAAGLHETLHAVIPSEVGTRLHDICTGLCVRAQRREFRIVQRLLTEIFDDDGDLDDGVSRALLDCILRVLSEATRPHQLSAVSEDSLVDRRLQDVLQFVERHFTDANLNLKSVAAGCGISVRYVSYLLKRHGTSFADLIWGKRLEAARRWLLSAESDHALVAQIGYRVGFKSAPHFNRMFKRAYQVTPGEYRDREIAKQ